MNEILNQNINEENNIIIEDDKTNTLPVECTYRDMYSNAVHLFEIKDFEEAAKLFLELYNQFPDKTENLINCGNCYYELLNTEEAVKYWNLAKEKNKYTINAYINLGNYYLVNEDYEKAKEEYIYAFCLNPHHEISAVNLAITYEKMQNKREAFLIYEFFLTESYNVNTMTYKNVENKVKTHKLNAISQMKIGIFHEQKGDYRKALQSYYEAIKIYPNFAQTYINIGNIFFKLEKFDFAKLYWLEAYKLDKNNSNLQLNLAKCCEKLDDLVSAYAFYTIFLKYNKGLTDNLQSIRMISDKIRTSIIANQEITKKYTEQCEKCEQEHKINDAILYYTNLSILSPKKEITAKIQELDTKSSVLHRASCLSFEIALDLYEHENYEGAIEKCKTAKILWKKSYFEKNINSLLNKCQSTVNNNLTNMIKARF